jgi:methionine-rich copper-binding protein CopC
MLTRRILASGLIAALLHVVIALGAPALAHSQKEGTIPEDGARLTNPPPVIELAFNAPMRITHMTLTNAEGDSFGLARDKSLAARKEFSARPDDLPAGEYTVEWRGLAEDGHAMRGAFSFTLETE